MAELNVTKKSVGTLLREMQRRKFVIPDYQRPYRWDIEKCEILWQDLTSFFTESQGQRDDDREYYLGTIVTCQSADGAKGKNLDVIDGQQRLTSLLLLLRAFYKKLEGMNPDDPNVAGLKSQIAPCIWDVNPISGRVDNFTLLRLESFVATDDDQEALTNVLRTGTPSGDGKDSYSTNYAFFLSRCEAFARDNPMDWQPFCVAILGRCIILPIECEQFDTALTIFSTLNDRGMPLSDSDIFKAQLYKMQPTAEAKREFTEAWKELTEAVEEANLGLDDLFRYYTHVIRARAGDTAKEIGLRKFYAGDDRRFVKLTKVEVMGDLIRLADRWRAINSDNAGEAAWISPASWNWIHCLSYYPNEYWKYVVSVFFFRDVAEESLRAEFETLLRILVAWMYSKFVAEPTVNAIKDPCFRFMNAIYSGAPLAAPEALSEGTRPKLLETYGWKSARGLLLLHACLHKGQTDVLPWKFDIEHILPRRWQAANYRGWSKSDARQVIERFGNKVILEKKLNIVAGNGYFGQKKRHYAKSKIAEVRSLSLHGGDDWAKGDIDARDEAFGVEVMRFFTENLPPAERSKGSEA